MEKRKLKFIYWFAYYNLDSPSVRYRAKYPLEFLKENHGVGSYLIIPGYSPKRIMKFLYAYFSALLFRKKDSLIVVQRVQSNFIYARLLKILIILRKQNSVYDLDDADYLEHNPKTIHYFVRNCENISAGSKEIVKYLSQFNKNIFHVTSPIIDLGLVKKERNAVFTIGWIGGFGWGHKDSLFQFVFPSLKELPFKYRFLLIGITNTEDINTVKKYFKDCKNIELILPTGIDWNNEFDIQKHICSFDIGIATLQNTLIQLSKSGIKAKQYLNNGVPVLSTNLPENNHVVVDGYNGYLCDSPRDFKERLVQFYTMTDDEYFQFSKNARDSIVHFDHSKYFEDLKKIKNSTRQKI